MTAREKVLMGIISDLFQVSTLTIEVLQRTNPPINDMDEILLIRTGQLMKMAGKDLTRFNNMDNIKQEAEILVSALN